MLKIEKAGLSDIKPCFELYISLVKNKYFATPSMIREETFFIKRFERMQEKSLPWVVAKERGDVVGFVSIQPIIDNHLWRPITELSIYVSEAHKGTSLAVKILDKALSLARDSGVNNPRC